MKKILNLKSILGLFMIIGIAASVYTYFTSLSKYSTSDQYEATLQRLKLILTSPDSVTFSNGSNLSGILVALPANQLKNKFPVSMPDDVAKESMYPEIYPFAFFQVVVSLLLIFYCIIKYLFRRIGCKYGRNNFIGS